MKYIIGGLSVIVAGNVALIASNSGGGGGDGNNNVAETYLASIEAGPVSGGDLHTYAPDQTENHATGVLGENPPQPAVSRWQTAGQRNASGDLMRLRLMLDATADPDAPWTNHYNNVPFLGIYCTTRSTRLHIASAPHRFVDEAPRAVGQKAAVPVVFRLDNGQPFRLGLNIAQEANGVVIKDSTTAVEMIRRIMNAETMDVHVDPDRPSGYQLNFPVRGLQASIDTIGNFCGWQKIQEVSGKPGG